MKFKMMSGGVPVGSYIGTFLGVEGVENEYGEALRWDWEITTGEFKGLRASRLTGRVPTLKNACGKLLSAVAGKSVGNGEEIDLAPCVGKTYLVIVGATDKGSTRVETATKPPLG
jgi:hypothetical protein